MIIAFVTTQIAQGSTVVGRIVPLAQELLHACDIHILVHAGADTSNVTSRGIHWHIVGKNPFRYTNKGKVRLKGFLLVYRMTMNALVTLVHLVSIHPDVVILVKPLPQNVIAVWWYRFFRSFRIVLDADDFELDAQSLSSLIQRAAVHWSERKAVAISHCVVTATPFLFDHFSQLTKKAKIEMIPTGIEPLHVAYNPTLKTILYIGSISVSSGHRVDLIPHIFNRVLKDTPDVTLIMAGSGDDVEFLQRQFTYMGIDKRVIWMGRFVPRDVAGIVQRSSVLIDPIDSSIANRAKSSFRTALGASCGIPMVTSNIGIRPLFIPPSLHDRFFAKAGDADDYAKKIIYMLSHALSNEERDLLQNRGKEFFWEKIARKYLSCIRA